MTEKVFLRHTYSLDGLHLLTFRSFLVSNGSLYSEKALDLQGVSALRYTDCGGDTPPNGVHFAGEGGSYYSPVSSYEDFLKIKMAWIKAKGLENE